MLLVILLCALYILNLGYGFLGSFQKLGSFHFVSRKLKGVAGGEDVIGNRFRNTVLHDCPIPLPRDYLQGIDRQAADFEIGDRSYLRGTWQERGWWYYHIYALGVKLPLGTLIMIVTAVAVTAKSSHYRHGWFDELCLLLPVIGIIGLISSQSGFSNHMRYVIPALPFCFIWISKIGMAFHFRDRYIAFVAILSLAWCAASSLFVFPHSLSYFNELVGGPRNGAKHLLDSNIAWGQDLLHFREWLDRHPEIDRIQLATIGWVDPQFAGINVALPPVAPKYSGQNIPADLGLEVGPQPGWYAIDVNFLHGTPLPVAKGGGRWKRIPPDGPNYEYFKNLEPVDSIGYSTYIYRVSTEQANLIRHELGLPQLTDK
ncbi:hypothetical protein [Symmachiella dynata]|uniref:hypothetical protein n=1 Tax=Symmachiella dynata TaxID=2527995 RepID=UPI003C6FB8D3